MIFWYEVDIFKPFRKYKVARRPILGKSAPEWVKTIKFAKNNLRVKIYDLENFRNKGLIRKKRFLQGKEHSCPFWGKSATEWVKTSKLAKKDFKFEIYDLKNVSMKCVIRT